LDCAIYCNILVDTAALRNIFLHTVVGTFIQQEDFNKEIYEDKTYETMDNTYENLNIEMPKVQTV